MIDFDAAAELVSVVAFVNTEAMAASHPTRFYRGYPVKRIRRIEGGVLLTLVARNAGTRGLQVVVSQNNLDKYCEYRELATPTMDALRLLVPDDDFADVLGDGDTYH